MFIFISGILISFVLPFFIKNNTVDWYYITLIMALYAVDFLADYLYGLPYRNLLIVNEKVYVINIIKTTQQIIFKIIELILIINHVNLILIILLSVIANLTGSFLLVNITKKFYPYLKLYKGKDKTVTKPVKDIAINNLSDIVNEKTDSIIIANQMGLKDTSIYSMYNLIINYIYMFILNFVTGVKASIGAIISNNNISREESYSIFKQFLLALNYISILCLIIFTLSASSFMGIFINTTYKESFMVVLLFGIVLWINVLSKTFHVIVEVKGYYKQIKNFALGQAIMNIILSLIFVQKLGILGVLLATVLTNVIIIMPMKAKIAFNEFDKSSKYFYKLILCSILSVTVILFICNKMNIYNYSSNLINWFLITGILFVVIAIVLFGYYYIIFKDFRDLVKRFLNGKLVENDETIKVDEILIDGKTVGDISELVVKDRELLSENGIVLVSTTIDRTSKKILSGPEILTRGFIYVKDNIDIIKEAEKIALSVINENINNNYVDFNKIKTGIRDKLGRYLYKETECKPMILIVIGEV